MKITIRNRERELLFTAEVDARRPVTVIKDPAGRKADVALTWDAAIDDRGFLRRCPVCGCRELFVRKDFSQPVGLLIVALAAITAAILFFLRAFYTAIAALFGVAIVDAAIYLLVGKCLVCYRCRSEFRNTTIGKDHAWWDLSIGEKYRIVPRSDEKTEA